MHPVGLIRPEEIDGTDAVEVMTENPYRLARDIRGIGFVTADAIAMKLGIEKTAMVRVRAGIGYALTEAMDEGHCGLPEEELGPLAAKLLEVPGELIRAALDLELAEGTVVADTVGEIPCIFLGGLHRAERSIAGRLLGIAGGTLPWPRIDPEKALPWVEGKTGFALAPGQADAVRAALSSKVSVITGGPGVGKTTIVNSILRILSAKGVDILLCAPTGRAAKRMSEATGLEAKTIHRLLEVDPRNGGFRRDAAGGGQLPSVGPGQVLADIIASGVVPVVRLTEVFRQAAQSRIVTTAHGIPKARGGDVGAPRFEIMEAAVAPTGPAFLVIAPRVRAEQDTAGLEGCGEVAEDPGQLAARHVEQRGICEDPVETGGWQVKREKVLVQQLTIRLGSRHGGEFGRSVEADRLVAERGEPAEIPAGPAA